VQLSPADVDERPRRRKLRRLAPDAPSLINRTRRNKRSDYPEHNNEMPSFHTDLWHDREKKENGE
jgi:hypothetical protein